MSSTNEQKNLLARCWGVLKRPSSRYSIGALLGLGVVIGILMWGGFHTVLEATNTEAFCISCHEMKDNVYVEYRDTIHYYNRSGVRATCSDCHVPKEWGPKMVRKIQASNEVWHKILGSINTQEKFEEKRLQMAQSVWRSMKKTDSRECRNCHEFDSMDYTKQGRRGRQQHIEGFDQGKTCIDCHKGIAHSLPAMYEVDPSAVVGAGR